VPVALKERNGELAKFLEIFELPEPVARFVERVELDRMEIQIGRQEYRAALQRLKARREREIRELRDRMQEKDARISELHRQPDSE